MPFPHSPSFMNLQRHPQYYFFLSHALKDLSLHLISCADMEVECLTTDSTLYNTNDLLWFLYHYKITSLLCILFQYISHYVTEIHWVVWTQVDICNWMFFGSQVETARMTLVGQDSTCVFDSESSRPNFLYHNWSNSGLSFSESLTANSYFKRIVVLIQWVRIAGEA